ncbi:MAG: transposase [bacterium]|nr:transposase [bacterium]
MAKKNGRFLIGYNVQQAVDHKSRMIVHQSVHRQQGDAQYTIPVVRDVEALKDSLPLAEGPRTNYVMDSGYSGEKNLQELAEYDLYVPDHRLAHEKLGGKVKPEDRERKQLAKRAKAVMSPDKTPQAPAAVLPPGTGPSFSYDRSRDEFTCLAGRKLVAKRTRILNGLAYRTYRTGGCGSCSLRNVCVGPGRKRKDLLIAERHLASLETYVGRPPRPLRKSNPEGRTVAPKSLTELMREKLLTPEGRKIYAMRLPTSEGVFGTMLATRQGFRFLRRGLSRVAVEWAERSIAHNLARLAEFRLGEN